MDEAEYCNRVSIMVDGEIRALMSPGDMKRRFNARSMEEVFFALARQAERREK
jgi:ABC-2 type transport system ATP-binding protein